MRLPLAALLVLALAMPLALAGCLGGGDDAPAGKGGEALSPAEKQGLSQPIVSRGYDGVLEASAAVADTSAGTAVPIDIAFDGDFRGFAAVLSWEAAAAPVKSVLPGVKAPAEANTNLFISIRKAGEIVALAQAAGPSPLVLKVEPSALEGVDGPFELYVSAAGANGLPVGAAANQPFHVDATAFFGARGAAQFEQVG
ncbi:MAG TPA: hypothetical protein VNZ52_04380 [Candidatus Thermoplasmatota archaeon]|nr:hypothetical protein [Candidatus Thermoplasmatota archaeon]